QAKESKQSSLFADAPGVDMPARINLSESYQKDDRARLAWEKELLGLYISEHPFNEFKGHLQNLIIPISGLRSYINQEVKIAGVVSSMKKIITRSNKTMLFVKIEDAL
ncbi:hypothetical protein, partial [Anaplasma marginale]